MNKYIGKICPYCKTPFQEGDDIVVCSSCDMPHHKDCWVENQGCTTFGCIGTIKAADGTSSTVTATEISYEDTPAANYIFCTKCGAKHSAESSFCTKCGSALAVSHAAPVYTQADPANANPYAYTQQNYNPQPTPQAYQQNNYYGQTNTYTQQNYHTYTHPNINPDVLALIGTNQEYYASKFQEMETQNKPITWNWVAFFFAPYWFMYRKMYGYGCAALGFASLVAIFNSFSVTMFSAGANVAAGLFANFIYMHWLKKNANQSKTMQEPYRTQFIQKNAGVNGGALALAIVGWILFFAIVSA